MTGMRIIDSANTRTVKALLNRRPARDPRIARRVSRIIERVRADGDAALLGFARRFDRLDEPIDVSRMEMVRAARSLDPQVRSAIRVAAGHIRLVARKQLPTGWSAVPSSGIRITQRVVPLDRVG